MSIDISQKILELEQQLLRSETRTDARLLNSLLTEDFVEFGAAGERWGKTAVIAGLLTQAYTARDISDFKCRPLGEHAVLVTYRCVNHQDGNDIWSLRSSIWELHDEIWRMVFHQGTRMLMR